MLSSSVLGPMLVSYFSRRGRKNCVRNRSSFACSFLIEFGLPPLLFYFASECFIFIFLKRCFLLERVLCKRDVMRSAIWAKNHLALGIILLLCYQSRSPFIRCP